MNQIRNTGVLVIGGGLAGLEAAWAAKQKGAEVMIVSKGAAASPAVLGFNAAVSEQDSAEQFAKDTFEGGYGIGDPALIDALCRESAESVAHMEALGQHFDRNEKGDYHLLQPLGCSVPRLVHTGNKTGQHSLEILRDALKDVEMLEGYMACELIVEEHGVRGAVILNIQKSEEPICVLADAVVLCCGGSHLLKNSTYPLCQTADGFAMAYRAGASLVDLEFIQHEPCRAVWPKPLGLSTTVLAKGGILTNRLGERFILKHYPSEGLVSKGMLARLVAIEILEGRGTEHGGVWLDLTGLPEDEIKVNHKLYYERFLNGGVDLTKERVEVGPAAHSMMGGVSITPDGFTGVPGLYAAGEVIGGLHGANRLGGNAGAETYVFGRRAGASAANCTHRENTAQESMEAALDVLCIREAAPFVDYEAIKTETRAILAVAMGPVRNGECLDKSIHQLTGLLKKACRPCVLQTAAARLEAVHMAQIGILACRAALERKESRGVHYRSDAQEMLEEYAKHIVWKKTETSNNEK